MIGNERKHFPTRKTIRLQASKKWSLPCLSPHLCIPCRDHICVLVPQFPTHPTQAAETVEGLTDYLRESMPAILLPSHQICTLGGSRPAVSHTRSVGPQGLPLLCPVSVLCFPFLHGVQSVRVGVSRACTCVSWVLHMWDVCFPCAWDWGPWNQQPLLSTQSWEGGGVRVPAASNMSVSVCFLTPSSLELWPPRCQGFFLTWRLPADLDVQFFLAS